ncbi:MAG: zinc ribbon domain-containing protein [Planctomycetia bacterium]|nr:zinc ribbon domain-containing protein [Planctomycetia bacterium]
MALLDCPECGHQVSDAAVTCPSCGVRLNDQTAQLQLQFELSQIELEWERERQRYIRHTKLGQPYFPTKGSAVVGALVSLVGGIGTAILFALIHPGSEAYALLFAVPLGVSFWVYTKAESYETARTAYLRKREAAQSKYKGHAEGQT